jgi:glycosyltransferase involved in cell wall biosynthesis
MSEARLTGPRSASHLVLIPSYNPGARLANTIKAVLAHWSPVWIVDDGSTDGSTSAAQDIAAHDTRVRVIVRPRNGGKGAAVATGIDAALTAGFTHVLTLDADGQHPVDHIETFMSASMKNPAALILGRPVFGPEVPLERLHGRKLSVWLAWLEILGAGIDDPLFGFRVYPAVALQRALAATRRARGFDFDPEVAVRMFWTGVPTLNLPAPCRYFAPGQGGVSHFNYLRDNLKLIWLHTRLLTQLLLWRWICVLRMRRDRRKSNQVDKQ